MQSAAGMTGAESNQRLIIWTSQTVWQSPAQPTPARVLHIQEARDIAYWLDCLVALPQEAISIAPADAVGEGLCAL
jgi:hypothetical protein